MKIDWTDYDLTDFVVKHEGFCSVPAKLITPNHIGTKFTQKNKIFRSSIWSLTGELLSASFPKFVNLGENPDNFPPPESLKNCHLVSKIDGSCCIVDYVNGQFSMRTRGTFSYKTMENAADFDFCWDNHPNIAKWIKENPHCSLLFEITTPNLRIVVDYGDTPKFWLIGAVDKRDYSLMPQKELDTLSKFFGVERPEYHEFSTINQLVSQVEKWTGQEGVCWYSGRDQEIHKIKGDWYRKLHAAKENFRSIEHVMDAWFVLGQPTYTDAVQKFTETYDYETMLFAQPHISKICDGYKEVQKILEGMKRFVDESLKPLSTRKEQALKTLDSYGKTNRASFVFKLLDGKTLETEDCKKLLYQVLKK